jgi:ubiquinone biosynthesis monooxygenase Coq7
MRVNHVGEVCAQALYTSQALGARLFSGNEVLAAHMEAAGREEQDHLAWSQARLQALNSRPSLLNPLWYAGAFGIGLLASRLGERASLGFVVETERQVEAHLMGHLDKLPLNDHEARHAREAQHAGAADVPLPVKLVMKAAAKMMTTVAHRV